MSYSHRLEEMENNPLQCVCFNLNPWSDWFQGFLTPNSLIAHWNQWWRPLLLAWFLLTLWQPAYLSVSKNQGGSHCAPQNNFGLGGVRVPILFGNDLPMNDLPYSKGFVKFGCLEPSKIMIDFWNCLMVERRVTQFVRLTKGSAVWHFGISDEFFCRLNEMI